MRSTTLRMAIVLSIFLSSHAYAGPVYLLMIINPPTEADAGIAPVNGMVVNSTMSGPNTWHLYAMDTNDNSIGIAQYHINLVNTTTVIHRSPVTTIQEPNDEINYPAGFSHFRDQAAGVGGFVQASQSPMGITPFLISGFGRSSSDFVTKKDAIQPSYHVIGPTTSGQWGNYATDPIADQRLDWLLLAEGQHTGFPHVDPVGSFVLYYNGSFANVAISQFQAFSCAGLCPPPVDVADKDIGDIVRGTVVMENLEINRDPEAFEWELVSFNSAGATVDAQTGEFTWDSTGAPLGSHTAVIRASHFEIGSDTGTLTFNLVPEASSITLFNIAVTGSFTLIRRRND